MSSAEAAQNIDKLPGRDIVLLPLLALLTIILVSVEVISYAAKHYGASKSTVNTCLIMNDRTTGVRGIPNSACSMKTAESGDVIYRFNACGHRADVPCGPKPPGTFRIVMIGSSVDFGFGVEREKTFSALLPTELAHLTGRKIEVYNEAMLGSFPYSAGLRLNEVLAAQPDMVLWVLAPRDIKNASVVLLSDLEPPAKPGGSRTPLRKIADIFTSNSLPAALSIFGSKILDLFRDSSTGIYLQDELYSSQSQYVRSYLMAPETDANVADVGFLKVDRSAQWQAHMKVFDDDAARIENRLTDAGIPLVATFVPERGQAAMIAMRTWPAALDPYKMGDDVRSIISSHGGQYVDILRDYRTVVNPEKGFYPIDGHPDVSGHAVISTLLSNRLTDGTIPQLARIADSGMIQAKGR